MPLLLSEICRLILGFLEEENLMKSYQVLLEESPFLEECRVYQAKGITFDTKIHGKSLIDYLWSIRFPDEFEHKKVQTDKSSRNQADKYVQTDKQVDIANSVSINDQLSQKPVDQAPMISVDNELRGSRKRKTKITRYASSVVTMSPVKQSQLISSSPNGSDDESDINVNRFIENLCTNDFAEKLAQSINDFKTKKNFNLSVVGLDSINNSSMMALLNPSQSEDVKKADEPSSMITDNLYSNTLVQPSTSCTSIGNNFDLFGCNSLTSLPDKSNDALSSNQVNLVDINKTEIDPIDANLGIDDISQLADMFAEEAFDLLTSDLIDTSDHDCTLTGIKGQGASILQFEAQETANEGFGSFESKMIQAIAESNRMTPSKSLDQNQPAQADETIRAVANSSIELIEDAETIEARHMEGLRVEERKKLLNSGQSITMTGDSSSITIQKFKRQDDVKEIETKPIDCTDVNSDKTLESSSTIASTKEESSPSSSPDSETKSIRNLFEAQDVPMEISDKPPVEPKKSPHKQDKQSSSFTDLYQNMEGDDEYNHGNKIKPSSSTVLIDQNKTSNSILANSQNIIPVPKQMHQSTESKETTILKNVDSKSTIESINQTTRIIKSSNVNGPRVGGPAANNSVNSNKPAISNESRLAQAAGLPDIFGYALQVQLSVKSRLREGQRKTMPPNKPPHIELRRKKNI